METVKIEEQRTTANIVEFRAFRQNALACKMWAEQGLFDNNTGLYYKGLCELLDKVFLYFEECRKQNMHPNYKYMQNLVEAYERRNYHLIGHQTALDKKLEAENRRLEKLENDQN